MPSYLSSILTHTTSRYNDLRRTLLQNEADGDTEDDTHISRVLRAYYVEKQRPFPPWLPPDPKAKQQPQPSMAYVTTNRPGFVTQTSNNSNRRLGGLSDLWDDPTPQSASQPQSLRSARGSAPPAAAAASYGSHSQPASLAQTPTGTPFGDGKGFSTDSQRPLGERPIPFPRGGSYESKTSGRFRTDTPPPRPSTASVTAQDRLKARLLGKSASPASPRGPFRPPSGQE